MCYTYFILCYSSWHIIPTNIKKAILGFAIIYFISAIFSDFPINSLSTCIKRLSPFAVFIAIWIIMDSNEFHIIHKSLTIIGIYVILWGGIQQIYSREFTLYFLNRISDIRIVSIFAEPQTAGCGIGLLALFFFNQYKDLCNKRDLIIFILLILIGALTGSKTFLLGTLTGIGMSLLSWGISPKLALSVIILGFIIFFTQELWIQLPVFERMKDIDNSYDLRSTVFWMNGWKIFEHNWIIGIGIGNFAEYNKLYIHLIYPNGELATQPESGYLLWLDETGVLTMYYFYILFSIYKKRCFPYLNFGLILPWLIAFISVYNLESKHIQFILYSFFSMIIFAAQNKGGVKLSPYYGK